MKATTRGALSLLLALALGVAAAYGAAQGLTAWREHKIADNPGVELGEPGTRVAKAIAGVRADGVHVSPDGRSMVDRAGERRLEKAVAEATVPVRVIVWSPSTQDGDWLQETDHLREAFSGEDGLVIVWEGPEEGDVLETGGLADYYDAPRGEDAIEYPSDFLGDPVRRLTAGIRATDGMSWRERSSTDSAPPVPVAVGLGALIAAPAIGLLLLLSLGVRRAVGGRGRLPGGWTWKDHARG